MCNDLTKQAKNVIDKIKKLLFNLEMTIVYANGEIQLRKSTMKLYDGETSKWKRKKFIEAKVDEERFQVFKEDVENTICEIKENLDIILSKYSPRYKNVFVLYFFEEKTQQEIADLTNYSKDSVAKIIQKFRNDLLTFYIP